ncbi:ABC transporter permease [Arthrobacter sp. Soil762]|uniref:ABC transporter permease n=1 Tax=Arthrobacter sp. Soil762 TaxID=1736401 RepID=UPI0006F20251|nr:ABC transporter permease [Arthrobacter sp. Soil762]KRE72135.1 hypothetical protein ASG77_09585 [Arthrobacter sp. Soil762]
MNQQSFGQKFGRATEAGPGTTPGGGSAKGVQKPAGAKPGTTNQAVLGPFTLRDLTVFAATLILLVASLLPIFFGRFNLWNAGSLFFLGLGIVLPLIVTALFVARRLAPATKVRIGSLSVDQFGSVVASFALAFFFVSTAAAFVPSLLVGLVGSVVLFAGTVLSRFIPYFAGDFLGRDETPAHVMARDSAVPLPKPHTPKEPKPAAAPVPEASAPTATPAATSAHAAAPAASAASAAVSSAPEVNEWTAGGDPSPATQAADVVPSPSAVGTSAAPAVAETSAGDIPTAAAAAPAPAATASAAAAPEAATHDAGTGVAAPARQSAAEPAATAVHQQVRRVEPIGATVDPASRPEESYEEPAHEAFWFAVAQHRTAVDPQTGAPAFVIEPGGWVLALEDRGHEFLVQHTDGRVGVLRDLSNIERG